MAPIVITTESDGEFSSIQIAASLAFGSPPPPATNIWSDGTKKLERISWVVISEKHKIIIATIPLLETRFCIDSLKRKDTAIMTSNGIEKFCQLQPLVSMNVRMVLI